MGRNRKSLTRNFLYALGALLAWLAIGWALTTTFEDYGDKVRQIQRETP